MAGPVSDLQLFSRRWGVDLEAASRAGATVDRHRRYRGATGRGARCWRSSIAGCTLTELPAEGHFWVAANYARGARLDRRRAVRRGSRHIDAKAHNPGGDACAAIRRVRQLRGRAAPQTGRSTPLSRSRRCFGAAFDRGVILARAGWPRPDAKPRLSGCLLGLALVRPLHPTLPSRSQRPARRYSGFRYSWHKNSEARAGVPGLAPGLGNLSRSTRGFRRLGHAGITP